MGIEPALDYFYTQNVSIGGSVFVRYANSTSGIGVTTSTLTYGFHARVGSNIPLGKLTSFRPLGGLGVWRQQTSFEAPGPGYMGSIGGTPVELGSDVSETAIVIDFFGPLLIHPAPHFFVGLGPEIYEDLSHVVNSRSNKRLFIGISNVVGGWF